MSKGLIPFHIQPQATEESGWIADPIATALENFDLIVEAFDPAARKATDEIVCDFIHLSLQRADEFVEAI